MARPISVQPIDGNTANTFGPVEGENVFKVYNCREGCSGCCGPETNVVLTNKRLIERKEEAAGCCSKIHSDVSVFLEDIEVLREIGMEKTCNIGDLLKACLTCTIICYLCSQFCSCCGDRAKVLAFAVGHGYENFTFNQSEAGIAAADITRAIMAAKTQKDRH